MPTNRSRFVHVVLALYPRRVRERYGAEITELLTHSPTPGRDLADVAWCALADRGASLTMSHARPHLLRLTGLLAAPLAFGVALAALASVAVAVLGLLEGFGYRVGYRLADVVIAASVVPVAVGTVWLARRTGRREHIAAPIFVVPTALALGIVAVASVPYIGEALGETWWATLMSSLCWYAATFALATGGAALIQRAKTGAAWMVMALGGVAILELTCTVYVLLVHRSYGLPSSSAFGAYPVVITGIDPGLVGAPAGQLAEALKGLPALLTVCTVFTLTLVITRSTRQHATPKPASAAPGTS
jgi:hypothetical protein